MMGSGLSMILGSWAGREQMEGGEIERGGAKGRRGDPIAEINDGL